MKCREASSFARCAILEKENAKLTNSEEMGCQRQESYITTATKHLARVNQPSDCLLELLHFGHSDSDIILALVASHGERSS